MSFASDIGRELAESYDLAPEDIGTSPIYFTNVVAYIQAQGMAVFCPSAIRLLKKSELDIPHYAKLARSSYPYEGFIGVERLVEVLSSGEIREVSLEELR